MGFLLDKINNLIVEHGSALVRGQHVELLREELRIVEKRIATLETENTALTRQLDVCQASLQAKVAAEEFVEHRGALFKRKPSGGYHLTVYCPNCRRVASSMEEYFPYNCNCGWNVEFTPHDLDRILKELPT